MKRICILMILVFIVLIQGCGVNEDFVSEVEKLQSKDRFIATYMMSSDGSIGGSDTNIAALKIYAEENNQRTTIVPQASAFLDYDIKTDLYIVDNKLTVCSSQGSKIGCDSEFERGMPVFLQFYYEGLQTSKMDAKGAKFIGEKTVSKYNCNEYKVNMNSSYIKDFLDNDDDKVKVDMNVCFDLNSGAIAESIININSIKNGKMTLKWQLTDIRNGFPDSVYDIPKSNI